MCSRLIRSRRVAAAAASSTRVLTPSVSAGSAATWATTRSPRATRSRTASVRYSSPWTLCGSSRSSAGQSSVGAEDVDRGVALLDRQLLGRRVARLDDRLAPSRRRRGRPGRTSGRRRGRRRARSRRRPRARCSATSASSSSVVRSGVSPERTSTSLGALPDRCARRADGVAGAERLLLHGDRRRRRTRRGSRARRSRRAGRARAAAPPRAPSRPSAGRGSGAGASASPSACACRALRPSPRLRVRSRSRR